MKIYFGYLKTPLMKQLINFNLKKIYYKYLSLMRNTF